MKSIYFIALLVVVLVSCSENETKRIAIETGMNQFYSGKIVDFYDNGNIMFITKYVEGKKEGKYIDWHKNGHVKTKGVYKNGLRKGVWTWSNENGEVYYAINYESGLQIS